MRRRFPHRVLVAAAAATTMSLAATPGWSAGSTHPVSGFTPVPGPAGEGVDLTAVTALSRTAAWTVGVRSDSRHPHRPGTAVVERWDGARWAAMAAPSSAAELTSVSAISAGNIWAAGVADQVTGVTRVWHFRHGRWTRVTARGLPRGMHASVVTAGAQVWLVGEVDPGQRRSGAFVASYRKRARAWSVDRLSKIGGFFGATALGPHSLYAVGSTSQFVIDGHPLVAHWNGKTWHVTTLTGISGGLTDVAAHSRRDVMAVGTTLTPAQPGGVPFPAGLAVRWNGHRWTTQQPHHPWNKLFTAVAAGPGTEYWAGVEGGPDHRATYLWFKAGKWYVTVGSKSSAASPPGGDAEGRQVNALAHVPGTRRTLAVGYGIEAGPGGRLPGPEALRETTTR